MSKSIHEPVTSTNSLYNSLIHENALYKIERFLQGDIITVFTPNYPLEKAYLTIKFDISTSINTIVFFSLLELCFSEKYYDLIFFENVEIKLDVFKDELYFVLSGPSQGFSKVVSSFMAYTKEFYSYVDVLKAVCSYEDGNIFEDNNPNKEYIDSNMDVILNKNEIQDLHNIINSSQSSCSKKRINLNGTSSPIEQKDLPELYALNQSKNMLSKFLQDTSRRFDIFLSKAPYCNDRNQFTFLEPKSECQEPRNRNSTQNNCAKEQTQDVQVSTVKHEKSLYFERSSHKSTLQRDTYEEIILKTYDEPNNDSCYNQTSFPIKGTIFDSNDYLDKKSTYNELEFVIKNLNSVVRSLTERLDDAINASPYDRLGEFFLSFINPKNVISEILLEEIKTFDIVGFLTSPNLQLGRFVVLFTHGTENTTLFVTELLGPFYALNDLFGKTECIQKGFLKNSMSMMEYKVKAKDHEICSTSSSNIIQMSKEHQKDIGTTKLKDDTIEVNSKTKIYTSCHFEHDFQFKSDCDQQIINIKGSKCDVSIQDLKSKCLFCYKSKPVTHKKIYNRCCLSKWTEIKNKYTKRISFTSGGLYSSSQKPQKPSHETTKMIDKAHFNTSVDSIILKNQKSFVGFSNTNVQISKMNQNLADSNNRNQHKTTLKNEGKLLDITGNCEFIKKNGEIMDKLAEEIKKSGFHLSKPIDNKSDKSFEEKTENFPITILEKTFYSQTENSAIGVFLPISDASDIQKFLICKVITQLFSEDFFDSLRTKQCLGYFVSMGYKVIKGHLFYSFCVQSDKQNSVIKKAILEYIIALDMSLRALKRISNTIYTQIIPLEDTKNIHLPLDITEKDSKKVTRLAETRFSKIVEENDEVKENTNFTGLEKTESDPLHFINDKKTDHVFSSDDLAKSRYYKSNFANPNSIIDSDGKLVVDDTLKDEIYHDFFTDAQSDLSPPNMFFDPNRFYKNNFIAYEDITNPEMRAKISSNMRMINETFKDVLESLVNLDLENFTSLQEFHSFNWDLLQRKLLFPDYRNQSIHMLKRVNINDLEFPKTCIVVRGMPKSTHDKNMCE